MGLIFSFCLSTTAENCSRKHFPRMPAWICHDDAHLLPPTPSQQTDRWSMRSLWCGTTGNGAGWHARIDHLHPRELHWETPDRKRREKNPGSQLCRDAGTGFDMSRRLERLCWWEQQHSMSTAAVCRAGGTTAAETWFSGEVPCRCQGLN